MLSLQITRWLLGYVRFSILGGSPERFFTNCARSGAVLWDISSRRNSGACISSRCYRGLRPCARRAGCRLRVRERHGLPFLLRRTRTHRGILAGAAAFAGILFLLSLHVWCIDVAGDTAIDTRAVLTELSEDGLYPGARISQINTKEIEQKLMLVFPQIRWMTINQQGCTMQVCIQDKTEQPRIAEQKQPCNLKASETGQIVAMRVFAGTAQVKTGDAVVQGQLLVSGEVKNPSGEPLLVHASAEIMAETTRPCEIQIPLRQTVEKPTGTKVVRKSLRLFGADLPLTLVGKPKGDCEVSGTRTDFRLFGTLLPVSFYEEEWDGVKTVPVTLSKEQALRQAREKLSGFEKNLPDGTKVLSAGETSVVKENTLFYSATLKCEENIAKKLEILIKS